MKPENDILLRIQKIVEDNFQNPYFNVEILSTPLHSNRSSVYRKVKALININTKEYIEEIRLQKAVSMLSNNYLIKEIAYKVGFSDPIYFSKKFKHRFGFSPTQFKKNEMEQNPFVSV